MVGRSRILIQQQETYCNKKDPIQIKFWKTPLERRPHGENRYSMSRRLPYQITKELEAGNQSNGRSTKEYEETV